MFLLGTKPANASSVTRRVLSLTSWIQSASGYCLAPLYQLGLHLLLRAWTLKSFPAGQHPPRHKSAGLGVSGWPKPHLLGHSYSKHSKSPIDCVWGKASTSLTLERSVGEVQCRKSVRRPEAGLAQPGIDLSLASLATCTAWGCAKYLLLCGTVPVCCWLLLGCNHTSPQAYSVCLRS